LPKIEVALVKGEDPIATTYQALNMINAKKVFSSEDYFLLKPNCVSPKPPISGITTDPQVIEGTIKYLKENGAHNIEIGEGGNRNTDDTFDITGMRDVATKHGIRIINFNEDEAVEIEIPLVKSLLRVSIAKSVLRSTCIVNVPKLKIHHMTQVTLSIKNLMGVIVGDRGSIMHKDIDEKMIDLATFVKPKLNVIDGFVGSEMDEVRGKPVTMNIVIAGTDMVAVDAVGSAVMGLDPIDVRHLKLAEIRGLGISNLNNIRVLGEPIETIKREFNRRLSKERLKLYGYNSDPGEKVLRPLWENLRSNLPSKRK
jgi:uncharacterized protein (DUF362 family)